MGAIGQDLGSNEYEGYTRVRRGLCINFLTDMISRFDKVIQITHLILNDQEQTADN